MTVAFDVLRYAILACFVCSALVALGSWAVRTRQVNPFGTSGRLIRRLTDPVLGPLETWLLRRGGNPHNSGWWLLGIVIVGGIVVLSTVQWLTFEILRTSQIAAGGPRGVARLLVYYASQLLLLALLVRVIGAWLGIGRYRRWMRPAYLATDWLVTPLRRIIPPFGMFDVTPVLAWFLVLLLRGLILEIL